MTSEDRPWLTFDCYDTLVRYSENKASALANLVRSKGGTAAERETAQKAFEDSERALQLGPFKILNEVLRDSLQAGMRAIGMTADTADEEIIIEAVKTAAPFPDVPASLNDLKTDHRLAILSNSEPDIIRNNIASIGIEFDAVVLAAEAKCYKPAPGMFHELLERIGAPAAEVTHIAQSFYHDMRTAKDLGFGRRLWINRYGREGDPAYTPDAELPDLVEVRANLG